MRKKLNEGWKFLLKQFGYDLIIQIHKAEIHPQIGFAYWVIGIRRASADDKEILEAIKKSTMMWATSGVKE